ncbi:ComEC/Rec2 family competence protein [Parapedomonas caeni]
MGDRIADVAAGAAAASRRLEAWLLAERDQWVLWVPVCMGTGIGAYFALARPAQWLAVAIACLGLVLLARWRTALGRVTGVAALLVVAGLLLAWVRVETARAPVLARPLWGAVVTGAVVEQGVSARGVHRIVVAPASIAGVAPAMMPVRVRLSLRAPPPADVAVGARVALRASLRPPGGPSAPGGYDFGRVAWFHQIGATGFVLGPVTVTAIAPPPLGWTRRLEAARAGLTARLRGGVGGEAGGVAAALVTGDRSGVAPDVTAAMRDSGLAHLLAISGLHIAIVSGGVFLLLRRLLCLSPWIALHWPVKAIAATMAASAAVGYTLIAGASLPTVRSCIATLIVLAGVLMGRQAISLRLIAAAAVLILVVRPEGLLSPSFQLSFAAVTGLVALYQSGFAARWLAGGPEDGLVTRGWRWLGGLLASGAVAEVALAPFALFHFNQTGVYGLVANLVAIPLTSFWIMPLLVLVVVLEPFGLADPLYMLLGYGIDLLLATAREVAGWPGAVARWRLLPPWAFVMMVLGLLWLALWRTRARWLGLLLLASGALVAWAAPVPDLYISDDGRLLAVRGEDGRLAFSTLRAGRFARMSWLEEEGQAEDAPAQRLADIAGTARVDQDCGPAVCRVALHRGDRVWQVAQINAWLPYRELGWLCAQSDVVVAARRLPAWCAPRLYRFDRAALSRTGAVTLRFLDDGSVRTQTTAAGRGRHPWNVAPAGAGTSLKAPQ